MSDRLFTFKTCGVSFSTQLGIKTTYEKLGIDVSVQLQSQIFVVMRQKTIPSEWSKAGNKATSVR